MSTSFPGGLDALNNPAAAGHYLGTAGVKHSDQHANANDAIEALETKVGIDGSTVATSLDYLTKTSLPAAIAALPKGLLAPPALVEADQSGITTDTDLTGVTVTATVGASRRIKVTCEVTVGGTVTGDQAMLRVKEGTTTLIEREGYITTTRGTLIIATAWLTPTAGVHTYKASLFRILGSGIINTGGAAATLAVEDVGPA